MLGNPGLNGYPTVLKLKKESVALTRTVPKGATIA
jgi:hypothetical protein